MTGGNDPDTSWQNTNFGLLWGKQFERGDIMVAYEYSKHDRPTLDEFWFSADADHRAIGGRDARTSNCPWPRVNFGGSNYGGPNRRDF